MKSPLVFGLILLVSSLPLRSHAASHLPAASQLTLIAAATGGRGAALASEEEEKQKEKNKEKGKQQGNQNNKAKGKDDAKGKKAEPEKGKGKPEGDTKPRPAAPPVTNTPNQGSGGRTGALMPGEPRPNSNQTTNPNSKPNPNQNAKSEKERMNRPSTGGPNGPEPKTTGGQNRPSPQVVSDPTPKSRPNRPTGMRPPSQETARNLSDRGRRDRVADLAQAKKIEDKDDAKKLVFAILGGAAAGAIVANIATKNKNNQPGYGYRPPVEEVGRTQMDRDRNVDYMVNRFGGNNTPPPNYGYQQNQRQPYYYEGDRRVVRYASQDEIPPMILASQQLDRVNVQQYAQSPYGYRQPTQGDARYPANTIPGNYISPNSYAVSYDVDPNSAMSQDDILFVQGSTDFADAYSYDLVIDIAEAMNHPSLNGQNFVIEGHASAEGDYGSNLRLSQERAERIARDLVSYGVSPERLMPIGYGEGEASYPSDSPEDYRRLDRRVMVFRMK
jgi:outer membrane protein OmpA-like peptidoglycan-associated protein